MDKNEKKALEKYQANKEFNKKMNKLYKRNLYLFHTEYEYNGEKFRSSIFAKSEEEAQKKLEAKRNTEKITGYNPDELHINPSEFI